MSVHNTRVVYAVEAVVPSDDGGFHSGYQFQFGDDALRNLWRDLHADCQEPTRGESPNPQNAMAQSSSCMRARTVSSTTAWYLTRWQNLGSINEGKRSCERQAPAPLVFSGSYSPDGRLYGTMDVHSDENTFICNYNHPWQPPGRVRPLHLR